MRRLAAAATVLLGLALAGCGASGASHVADAPATIPDATIPAAPATVAPQPANPRPRKRHRASRPRPRPAAPAAPPSTAPDVSSGAPSDAEVQAELKQLYGGSAGSGGAHRIALSDGTATAPPDAPPAVQAIVAAANQVARLPYVYGGGHGRVNGPEGTWIDTAYDCSGSVSFALASAGLVSSPMDSSTLARWGKPGPGRWVTIYANAVHAFMVVGGARFDTVGLRQSGSRWQPAYRAVSGFTLRHPAGL
jgi:cell wall-associated NlpC family hydrolase